MTVSPVIKCLVTIPTRLSTFAHDLHGLRHTVCFQVLSGSLDQLYIGARIMEDILPKLREPSHFLCFLKDTFEATWQTCKEQPPQAEQRVERRVERRMKRRF